MNNFLSSITKNIVKQKFLPILILLITLPSIVFAVDPPDIPEGWSAEYAYINDIRIHYYRAVPAPGKPVIVMVHGITDNGLCWAGLAQELQQDYNIFMLDARGHGLSDPFTPSDDVNTLMKDVVGFIKTMGFKKPILIGHSMGAATVMRVGAEYPKLARAIIMLDPFIARPPGDSPPVERNSDKEEPEVQETSRISIKMKADPETLVKQNNYSFGELGELGQRQFPKWSMTDIKYWALSKKQYHGAYNKSGWDAMSGNMQTGNSLGRIEVPSLVLKADGSPQEREENLEAVKDLKKIKLFHLKDTGHNLHHDDLELTLKKLNPFLSKL